MLCNELIKIHANNIAKKQIFETKKFVFLRYRERISV